MAFVEAILVARARRRTLLDQDLLFDPAWSMLIDLYRAALLGKSLSVTAVMIGSGVPDTTALRYLRILEERGYVERFPDKNDRRRIHVRLSPQKFMEMADYFRSTHAALSAQTF
ncbi:winged helix DNA-binding protein [Erythrobacter donghaensis]|uniref:winged helix DNA-binding protein n=1 Tax=Erythrobacter donghaensis TaxID=267135 RepID=UPI001302DFE4|nr:winged helix DNA-binding protein [Erythrobacter donghaensis]